MPTYSIIKTAGILAAIRNANLSGEFWYRSPATRAICARLSSTVPNRWRALQPAPAKLAGAWPLQQPGWVTAPGSPVILPSACWRLTPSPHGSAAGDCIRSPGKPLTNDPNALIERVCPASLPQPITDDQKGRPERGADPGTARFEWTVSTTSCSGSPDDPEGTEAEASSFTAA